jgi:MGT family glycosyltransferase
MKVAFLTVCTRGHLYPTTTLARKLKGRGHDVVLIAVPEAEPFADAAGIPFMPCCEEEYPVGSIAALLAELSRLQAQEAFEYSLRNVTESSAAMFKHLPRTLTEARIDGLVLDQVVFGLGLVPRHLGIPYVHISNALHLDFSGFAPLACFDWPHQTTPAALTRNREGLRKLEPILEPDRSLARDYGKRANLDVDWDDPFATISELAWLTQTPKEFDFENPQLPPQFHHTGPFHDGAGRLDSEFPWDRLTGEPLIYASMGTLQNGLEAVVSAIAAAVGARPGKQLVLSIGPALDPGRIRSLPADTIVVRNAPQVELLKRSALCITHAGLNTALKALTQGVPMVAIPVTNDQPGVAARIAHTQTGKSVPIQDMTAPRLSSLIEEVLDQPVYRRNAGRMKQAIAETVGLEKAVDVLEEKFDLSRELAPS